MHHDVALDTQYGASSLILYQWNGRIQECGIENMTLVSDYDRRYSKMKTIAGQVFLSERRRTVG